VITNIMFLLLGGMLGAMAMALVTFNRSEPDEDDSELLDFITRNDLGLSVIKHDAAPAMWGVTTPQPVKIIGSLHHDPRDALQDAMVAMLEKEPEDATRV